MTASQLREAIQDRIDSLGLSSTRAATLAGLPTTQLVTYLHGGDMLSGNVLRVIVGLGLEVSVEPGPVAPEPARRGRPKKTPE
jgi:hypothetical protein